MPKQNSSTKLLFFLNTGMVKSTTGMYTAAANNLAIPVGGTDIIKNTNNITFVNLCLNFKIREDRKIVNVIGLKKLLNKRLVICDILTRPLTSPISPSLKKRKFKLNWLTYRQIKLIIPAIISRRNSFFIEIVFVEDSDCIAFIMLYFRSYFFENTLYIKVEEINTKNNVKLVVK